MIVGPANKDGGLPISCPWRDAHTTGDGGAMYWPAHTGGYARGHFKCMHAHCEKRTDKEFADAIGFTAGNDVLSALILAGEIGLSEKFAERYADSLRYVTKLKRWYVWDGMRWKEDTKGEAKLAAKAFCDEIAALVREGMPGEDEDPTRRRAIVQAARYFESAHMVGAVLDLANCEPALVLDVEMLDRDDLLFNTPVGTVDLRTGAVRPHQRADYITKLAAASPVDEPRPVFAKFLNEVTCGDQDLAGYLQVALGACLSGAICDHWLMFWHGQGRNGKNTLGDLVLALEGDYAKAVPTQTLMADERGNRHPTEIANLRGLRLAVSSEVSDGQYWDEAKLKSLTGDAMLTGRFMRADFIEFPRTHKHLVYGNHRPMLRITDRAMAERLHLVPFNATFTAELGNLDVDMPKKLLGESGGILQWLIEGHKRWLEAGTLRRCAAVKLATDEYFASQSTLDMWLKERWKRVDADERSAKQWPKAGDLYMDYVTWKKDRNEFALSQTRWGEQMGQRFKRVISDGRPHYAGIEPMPAPSGDGKPPPTCVKPPF